MSWHTFVAGARSRWQIAMPHCQEPDCSLVRRTWRHIRWWNARIRLHDCSYCAPQCFEKAAHEFFLRASRSAVAPQPIRHRIPLGLLMLSRGQLTNQQLRSALDAQQKTGQHRLGEWLEKLGFATEQQVTAALGVQWSCPVLVPRIVNDGDCARLLPFRLLETFRMAPVQFVRSTRIFFIAFCDGIDYTALYAIEQMLNCRTEACLISRSAMDDALERIGHESRPGELLFESWRDAAEMARITCGYLLKLGADQARIVACGEYIWVALEAGRDIQHLLFRRPVAAHESKAAPFSEIHSLPRESAG
jgi:hypothetical protein